MAGLLDQFDLNTPQGQAYAAMAQGLLGGGSNAQRFAGGAGAYAQMMQIERARALREAEMRQMMEARAMEMEARKRQQQEAEAQRAKAGAIEQAYRGAIRTPDQQAMGQFGGPTRAAAQAAPGMQPQIDQQALLKGLMQADPMAAFQMLQPKPDELMTVAPGASVINKRDPSKALFTSPKEASLPSAVQEYQFAKQQGYPGSFEQWRQSGKPAGTTVNVNTAQPMMNAVAGGLGKQIDDTLSAAKAAVPSIQTAQTLRAAIDSGKIVTGPGATFRVLGLQVGQMMGIGGKDGAETLLNTRTAIQSMAQAELSAAQMMKGQGQITEAERDIIRRAAAGNINDMTAPELRLLSEVMEKTARFKISQHKNNLQGLAKMPGAEPILPFYQLDEPAQYAAPSGAGVVRVYDPKTGTILPGGR